MDIETLLIESLQLLGLGMGAVFVILILLIVLIQLVSRLVPDETPAPASQAPVRQAPAGVDPNHVAAITAALHLHRKRR